MGTVRPFFQPLRFFAHWLSRLLATTQTIVVLRNGGRAVSLADTVGPIFRQAPRLMFSTDSLHPSALGYARAAEVLLPSVCAAAGYHRDGGGTSRTGSTARAGVTRWHGSPSGPHAKPGRRSPLFTTGMAGWPSSAADRPS